MTTPLPVTPHPRFSLDAVRDVADAFAEQRHDRQRRRHLDGADFDRLRDAGFLLTGVPVEYGGVFESVERSTRTICDALRILAGGDASVALVASMHPAVVYSARWLVTPEAPEPYAEAWRRQREEVFASALAGHWWGTIVSEPASGGDFMRTRTVATPDGAGYRITGEKHFGSGSGITSFMITAAVPEHEGFPDWFVLDMRDVPWDGSRGVRLLGEWDGHGMTATQSHAFAFDRFPAARSTHPGGLRAILEDGDGVNPGLVPCLFAAIIVGIVQQAVETAKRKLQGRRDTLGAYERTEWTRVLQGAWLIEQAFEGMLRATESAHGMDTLRGKTAIAELAETLMTSLCRVMGGGSFARHSPFGFWFEDVRALGFLRPPWALAYAALDEAGWSPE
jgi:alkylation response protein AidB-like acyl-CoA dehydrogenase